MTPENEIREAAKGLLAEIDRGHTRVWIDDCGDTRVKVYESFTQAVDDVRQALEASPEGERGDGKGHDYGPSASASEVVNTADDSRVAEWQPIESAPKDGTPILIWEPNAVDIGYFWKDHGWHYCNNSTVPCAPTHWMPLPNPPVAQPDEKTTHDPTCRNGIIRNPDRTGPPLIDCPTCRPDEKVCGTCGGKGTVTDGGRNEFGNLERLPCSDCSGTGRQPVPPSEGECATADCTNTAEVELEVEDGVKGRYCRPCADVIEPSEDDADGGEGFTPILAFDNPSRDFVLGCEVGRLWEQLKSGDEVVQEVHADNAEMLMRISEATGRTFTTDTEHHENWILATFPATTPESPNGEGA